MTYMTHMRRLVSAGVITIGSAFPMISQASSIVFTDSFEAPSNTASWQVYPDNFGEWDTTQGAGIEVQTNRTLSYVDAHDGNQYIELDSHGPAAGGNPGVGTNSAMTRILQNLTAGQYQLDFYYAARTHRADDNTIDVYFDADGDALMTNLLGSANGQRSGAAVWTLFSFLFEVDGSGSPYALTFAANGRENTVGGFIDSVTLTQTGEFRNEVPIPAAAWLFISALGAGGVLRRRQARR